ncbi:MAG: hypothetical protein ONB46_00730 [candidate division KSB1 bacterium]|nr:hypothetical protein [candidate division KSB1 bacterium]MDZ7364634.1 hypothetical protein [candidate division KSB1 bacterium]MDZ7402618.1 hypothetical protein [candidate division KSB1 bacterium]
MEMDITRPVQISIAFRWCDMSINNIRNNLIMDHTPYIKKLCERKAQEKMLAENKRQQALNAAQEIANVLNVISLRAG